MVDTNSIGRSMNGRTSNQKGCKNMIESDSVRSSLGLRQSHSSESANSEETCGSTDRLKVQFDAAVQLIQNLPSDGNLTLTFPRLTIHYHL